MKYSKRALIACAALLFLGLTSLGVMAEEPLLQNKTITGFVPPESITLAVGDSEASLPTALTATVDTIITTQVADENGVMHEYTERSTENETLPVTWTADTPFSSATAGSFTYTAALQDNGLILEENVHLPTLIVSVQEVETQTNDVSVSSLEAPISQNKMIAAFVEPAVIELTVSEVLLEAELMARFPQNLSATVDGVEGENVPVTSWGLVSEGSFSTEQQAEFFYEPTLPDGYLVSSETFLPVQKVQVGESLVHEAMLTDTSIPSGFTVTGDAADYSYLNTQLTIIGSGPISIENTDSSAVTNHTIVVQDGVSANVMLNNVKINVNSTSLPSTCAFEIAGSGVANITLQGVNSLVSGGSNAGLQVQTDATLNLSGTGTLTASGGDGGGVGGGAGIGGSGGNIGGRAGIINIISGTVNAFGISDGAGIGGGGGITGYGGAGGTVNITDGTIMAMSSTSGGAGIGGGASNLSNGGSGGNINIMGGTVRATGNNGGAGIGNGKNFGDRGSGSIIHISAGTITAASGTGGQAFSSTPFLSPPLGQMLRATILAGTSSVTVTEQAASGTYYTDEYAQLSVQAIDPTIVLGTAPEAYTGRAQTQSVTLIELPSIGALAQGSDYNVTGNTATNAGTYTLTLSLNPGGVYDAASNSNFIGTYVQNYSISQAPLTITAARVQNKSYDGAANATLSGVTFSGLVNGETFTQGTDYIVNASFASVNAGDAIMVNGTVLLQSTDLTRNYTLDNPSLPNGTEGNITPLSLENAQVTLGPALVESGVQQTQTVDSVVLNGGILREGIDYTIGGNTATAFGNYTLFIYGRGNYSGTRSLAYTVSERTSQESSSSTVTSGATSGDIPNATTALSPQTGVLS